jgi:hypothetical protein
MPGRVSLALRPRTRRYSIARTKTALLAVVVGTLLTVVPTAVGSATDALPVITYTIDGISGTNGWYRGSTGGNYVVLRWSVSGADNTDCTFAVKIQGPSTGTTRSCSASNAAGPVTASTKLIKIDADPPTGVGATANRPPDVSGWYNHALGVSWYGSDATSGLAACTSASYAGPDADAASVGGGCTDSAGNTSTTAFAFRYDATAPTVSATSVESRAAADVLSWKSSSPSDIAVIRRVPRGKRTGPVVFRGAGAGFADKKIRAEIEYRYFLRTYDQAGNASREVSILALPKVVTLGRKTPYVPRAVAQPILRWSSVRGATYYHVQLFRRGKRILAAWPLGPQLGLRPAWKWAGRAQRLTPGRYRWYAWAGFGRRSAANYRPLGKADFVITRSRPG